MARKPRFAFWRVAALMLVCLLTACRTELYARLDESDANAVLDVLYAEGIEAAKVPGESNTWRVEVDNERLQEALHITREQGVPRQRFATMGELFKKEGLVSTPSEERSRFLFGVSQELANTLSQIDGVVSARVHPVIPIVDPMEDKLRPASAAVFIKHKADADLQKMAPAIKTLVSRSIEGLNPDSVSLTFFASDAPRRVKPVAPAPVGHSSAETVTAIAGVLALALAATLAAVGVLWRRLVARAAAVPAPRPVRVRPIGNAVANGPAAAEAEAAEPPGSAGPATQDELAKPLAPTAPLRAPRRA